MPQCTHLDEIRFTSTDKHVCEECVKTGDRWVHLRLCLECGHVGCCDSSKNKHATKHFHRTKHPLIRSIEPEEAWVWCFVDDVSPGEVSGNNFVPSSGLITRRPPAYVYQEIASVALHMTAAHFLWRPRSKADLDLVIIA